MQFIKDPEITCQVETATKVRFQGEVMSPSGAALRVLHQLGYHWSSCAGSDYWTYEGVKLSAMTPMIGAGETRHLTPIQPASE